MASSSFYSGSSQDATNVNAVEDSKNAAALSEAAAAASAAASANSAASVSAFVTTATTKASESAASATASSTSAAASQASRVASEAAKVAAETAKTAAETARDAASASEVASGAAEVAAETAETNAAASAAAAEAAQAAAEAAKDAIDGLYLGAQASDPAVDGLGAALTPGDWYYNTTSNVVRIYDGSAFVNGSMDGSLFATAAQGTLADSAVQPNDSPSFGSITVSGTVDGRDVATDGTKLDGIEAGADVTDTANVTAAGALMDSEVTNLAQVKAFDSSDYATAAQGANADTAYGWGDHAAAGYTTPAAAESNALALAIALG